MRLNPFHVPWASVMMGSSTRKTKSTSLMPCAKLGCPNSCSQLEWSVSQCHGGSRSRGLKRWAVRPKAMSATGPTHPRTRSHPTILCPNKQTVCSVTCRADAHAPEQKPAAAPIGHTRAAHKGTCRRGEHDPAPVGRIETPRSGLRPSPRKVNVTPFPATPVRPQYSCSL
jgi:hypothetical protein